MSGRGVRGSLPPGTAQTARIPPAPTARGRTTARPPRAREQQTFLLDQGAQLLPDAVAPARDVHVQRVVTARLPVRPLPPPLHRLGQAGLGLRHHMVHCGDTGVGRGPRAATPTALHAASHPHHPRSAPRQLQGRSKGPHHLHNVPGLLQVHLSAGKHTEPLLNGLWHRTRGFHRLLLRDRLKAEGPCPASPPLPHH